MKKQHVLLTLASVLVLVAVWFTGVQMPVQGAPAMIPTPVTQYMTNFEPKRVEFFSAASITADTRRCAQVGGYNTMDLHTILDQGTVNTTTLTLQFSNVPNSFVNGVAAVSANAADATDLKEFQLFGDQACVFADVTNSNALSLTVVGLLK